MSNATKRDQIITCLYDSHKTKGFITEDEALSQFVALEIPLTEIDSITEHLLSLGIIIQADNDDDYVDRSKLDYDDIFDEVVDIEPGLSVFIKYVRAIVPPQNREWQNLIPQAQSGNSYARNRLIEMYLRTVIKQALYSSKKHHLPLEDTIQDGVIGLIKAIIKFESTEHEKFSTYAPWWITQTINRRRRLPNNPMRFPVHMRDTLFPIQEVVLEHVCERCPRDEGLPCPELAEQLAEKLEWTTEQASSYIGCFKQCISIDEIDQESNELSDRGFFEDEIIELLDKFYNNNRVMHLLKHLTPRDKQVLILRYGFTDKGVMTLEEVGKILDITRERVRQIEKRALERIRNKTAFRRISSGKELGT